MRWSITGTIGQLCTRSRSIAASTASGSNLRWRISVLAVTIARPKCAKPHWWNSGAATSTRSRAAQRDRGEERDRRADARRAARGALRRAGRARGEDRLAALALGRHRRRRVAPLDQLLERRVGGLVALVRPRHEAAAAVQRVRQQLGELRVVDDRARLLALDHLGQLRAGEGGVEQHRVGAELGQRDQRLDHPAVVAAHHRDALALQQPLVGERVGEPVRALVDLGEGERAALVDHAPRRRGTARPPPRSRRPAWRPSAATPPARAAGGRAAPGARARRARTRWRPGRRRRRDRARRRPGRVGAARRRRRWTVATRRAERTRTREPHTPVASSSRPRVRERS